MNPRPFDELLPDRAMPVVCESFVVLYSAQGPRQPTAL